MGKRQVERSGFILTFETKTVIGLSQQALLIFLFFVCVCFFSQSACKVEMADHILFSRNRKEREGERARARERKQRKHREAVNLRG